MCTVQVNFLSNKHITVNLMNNVVKNTLISYNSDETAVLFIYFLFFGIVYIMTYLRH